MPSGTGARARVSLLLVAVMLVPTVISFSALGMEREIEEAKPTIELGFPMHEDPSRGWELSLIHI